MPTFTVMRVNRSPGMRIGLGVDFHPFAAGRKLILGGVEIPHEQGLIGHSDADVLTHAVCDALLGAAGLGDIGVHFPSDDPQYRDVSSLALLERVNELLRERDYEIGNVDATVVAEGPPLADHLPRMVERLARTLGVDPVQINLKATRPEGLGALGRAEGVMAQAIALMVQRS